MNKQSLIKLIKQLSHWAAKRGLGMGPSTRAAPRGQSLIEFTFMVIILTMILLGVLDLGRAYFTWMALFDAAGEGATYGSVNPAEWCSASEEHYAGGACPADFQSTNPNNIVYRVVQAAPAGTLVDWSDPATTVNVAIEGDPAVTDIKPGMKLTVIASARYRLLTPFVGSLVGSQTISLSATGAAQVLAP